MGTTVWVEDDTRAALRRLQQSLGTPSVDATIRALLRPGTARALFERHRDAIQAILTRRHVRGLVAYGSRARGDHRPDSDLDLAAYVDGTALDLLGAEADLEELLGVRVSLVELPRPLLEHAIRRDGVPFA